jgi:hypothetical protein
MRTHSFSHLIVAALLAFPLVVGATSVTPTEVEFVGNPGDKKLLQFNVTNDTSNEIRYEIGVENFKASGQDGVPEFLPADKGDGIAAWADYLFGPIPFQPGETKKIGVVIAVPPGTPSGGAYGSVFLKEAAGAHSSGAAVQTRVGILVFGTIGAVPSVPPKVLDFSLDRDSQLSVPKAFGLNLRNEQNSHVSPHGALILIDMFGNTVASLPINNDNARILPGTSRHFDVNWRDGGYEQTFGMSKVKPGLYRAVVKLTTGNGPLDEVSATSFIVLPGKYFFGIILIFGLLVFALARLIGGKSKHAISNQNISLPPLPPLDVV